MPVFISMLWGALLNIVGSLVGRVLSAIGMGLVVYVGMGSTLDYLKQSGVAAFTSLPPEVSQIFGLMRMGEAFSMIASTVVIKLVSGGLSGNTAKKLNFK